jgi:exopolyphosphatase/guanosine-5'-triphosphate,3'-diphosphate pyrophosphatase
LDELKDIHQLMLSLNCDGRRLIPGMDSDRVENIVLASIMVQWTLRELRLNELWQCAFALKEGAILQIINNEL